LSDAFQEPRIVGVIGADIEQVLDFAGGLMREQVIQVVEQYIDAVRHNEASALPLHPDAVCEFPTNTYRGAASFRKRLDDFARIMKSIEVIRLVRR
jgi:hypothetical protein